MAARSHRRQRQSLARNMRRASQKKSNCPPRQNVAPLLLRNRMDQPCAYSPQCANPHPPARATPNVSYIHTPCSCGSPVFYRPARRQSSNQGPLRPGHSPVCHRPKARQSGGRSSSYSWSACPESRQRPSALRRNGSFLQSPPGLLCSLLGLL